LFADAAFTGALLEALLTRARSAFALSLLGSSGHMPLPHDVGLGQDCANSGGDGGGSATTARTVSDSFEMPPLLRWLDGCLLKVRRDGHFVDELPLAMT